MKSFDQLFDGSDAHLIGNIFICEQCRKTKTSNGSRIPKCHRRKMVEYDYTSDYHEGSLDHIHW